MKEQSTKKMIMALLQGMKRSLITMVKEHNNRKTCTLKDDL